MELQRPFARTLFPPEVLLAARATLAELAAPASIRHQLEVELANGEAWTHDSEEAFFADYRKGPVSAKYALFGGTEWRIYVSYKEHLESTTTVAILASSRESLARLLAVFERSSEASRLPDSKAPAKASTSVRRSWRQAILVGERDLEFLDRLVSGEMGETRWTARLSDRSDLKLASVREVIGLENFNHRYVERLTCETGLARGYSFSLTLGRTGLDTIDLSVSADDKRVTHLVGEIEKFTRALRPRYSVLTSTYVGSFAATGMVLLIVVLLPWSRPPTLAGWLLYLLWAVGAAFFVAFFCSVTEVVHKGPAYPWLADGPLGWLFPRVFFDLGRQKEELTRRTAWRKLLFAGLGLGVLGNLIAAIMLR